MGVATERYSKQHAEGRFAGGVPAPRKGAFLRCDKFNCFYLVESVSDEAVTVRTIGEGKLNHTWKVWRGEWPAWCEKMKIRGFRWGVR